MEVCAPLLSDRRVRSASGIIAVDLLAPEATRLQLLLCITVSDSAVCVIRFASVHIWLTSISALQGISYIVTDNGTKLTELLLNNSNLKQGNVFYN